MSKKESINNFLKHKRLIIISLVAIGLIVMIMLVYILTYTTNKPKAFTKDTNVKIKNKCDYFDFSVVADEVDLKGNDGKPNLILKGKISNLKDNISNASVTFEVHTNWTTKTDVSNTSSVSFNSGKTITANTDETYSTQSTVNLSVSYPVKVIPLVRVKTPTVYAKVTFDRKTPEDMKGNIETVTETVYYKFSYNDLDIKTVIS